MGQAADGWFASVVVVESKRAEVPDPDEVSELLTASGQGDSRSTAALVERLYSELTARARQLIRPKNGVLDTASLVNDVYLRLLDQRVTRWEDRAHFFGIAARTLRRVLIDRLRASGRRQQLAGRLESGAEAELSDPRSERVVDAVDLIDLHEALGALGELDPELERLAEFQLFGGLAVREIASVVGRGKSSVGEDLAFVRAWLGRRLQSADLE